MSGKNLSTVEQANLNASAMDLPAVPALIGANAICESAI